MSGREVASVVWTAMSSGTKLAAKTYAAIRRAKGKVKKAKKSVRKNLEAAGIPKEVAKQLADAYTTPAMDMLSVRKLIRMLSEIG